MRENTVKTKLAKGQTLFGTMMFEFLSPGLPKILANAGADFVFYDMEHSGFSVSDMKTQFALCAGAGIIPFVRPPGKEYQFTARLLDVGAFGTLYQMVESAAEAEELVRWERYPQDGIRGAIFGVAHDDYAGGSMAEKIIASHDRTMTIVLIETKKGLENIDEILAVDGVDAATLGMQIYQYPWVFQANLNIRLCSRPLIKFPSRALSMVKQQHAWHQILSGARILCVGDIV